MSYALRNSILLGILLVIFSAIGVYWVEVRWSKEVEVLEKREADLKSELRTINEVLSIYDTTHAKLNQLKARWQARKQIVPADDSPAQTLAYLYELLNPLAVNFDFMHKGRSDNAEYSVNGYALQGEGKFEDIHAFIWHLEHGRRFHTIDRIQLDYTEPEGSKRSARWHWTKFVLLFRSYFEPGSRVEDLPASVESVNPDLGARNPFRPLITKTLPENRRGLFEAEGSRLRALTHNLAYLVDEKGTLHLLRKGDEVFMGKLDKIDIFANRVEFVLNKGGIWERVILEVESESP